MCNSEKVDYELIIMANFSFFSMSSLILSVLQEAQVSTSHTALVRKSNSYLKVLIYDSNNEKIRVFSPVFFAASLS